MQKICFILYIIYNVDVLISLFHMFANSTMGGNLEDNKLHETPLSHEDNEQIIKII